MKTEGTGPKIRGVSTSDSCARGEVRFDELPENLAGKSCQNEQREVQKGHSDMGGGVYFHLLPPYLAHDFF